MTIKIKNWSVIFENNRTRELKRLEWVPVPNKMDGDGYTELLDHPNGAAHLGAWLAILQIASKSDSRGTLLRDGAVPHTAVSLARISRIPSRVFDEVIPRLQSIGWIDVQLDESEKLIIHTAEDCGNPAPNCGKPPIEGNGIEGNGITPSSSAPPMVPLLDLQTEKRPTSAKPWDLQDQWFEQDFWPIVWRKVDKADAKKAFRKHAVNEAKKNQIVESARIYGPVYLSRDVEKRPHASTWLNKFRYDEPPEELSAGTPKSKIGNMLDSL